MSKKHNKSESVNTFVIRDASIVLKDFHVDRGMISLIKGRELPAPEEIAGVIQFEAENARSGLEVGANMFRFADTLPPIQRESFGPDGKPIMNGNAALLVPVPAKQIVMEALGNAGKTDAQIASMLSLVNACIEKERLVRLIGDSVKDVSAFSIAQALKFTKEAFGEKDGKLVLNYPAAKETLRLLEGGKLPVNAGRDAIAKDKIAANVECVNEGKATVFAFNKSDDVTSDYHKNLVAVATAKKAKAIKLSDDEVKALAPKVEMPKQDTPPVNPPKTDGPKTDAPPAGLPPITTLGTGKVEASDNVSKAYQDIFNFAEQMLRRLDVLADGKVREHAPNECVARVEELLRALKPGVGVAINWLTKPKALQAPAKK